VVFSSFRGVFTFFFSLGKRKKLRKKIISRLSLSPSQSTTTKQHPPTGNEPQCPRESRRATSLATLCARPTARYDRVREKKKKSFFSLCLEACGFFFLSSTETHEPTFRSTINQFQQQQIARAIFEHGRNEAIAFAAVSFVFVENTFTFCFAKRKTKLLTILHVYSLSRLYFFEINTRRSTANDLRGANRQPKTQT